MDILPLQMERFITAWVLVEVNPNAAAFSRLASPEKHVVYLYHLLWLLSVMRIPLRPTPTLPLIGLTHNISLLVPKPNQSE